MFEFYVAAMRFEQKFRYERLDTPDPSESDSSNEVVCPRPTARTRPWRTWILVFSNGLLFCVSTVFLVLAMRTRFSHLQCAKMVSPYCKGLRLPERGSLYADMVGGT